MTQYRFWPDTASVRKKPVSASRTTRWDVSSKSYDRWTYMPEKRSAMGQWNAFVASLLQKAGLIIAA
jgi:hypothetical protein